MGLLDFKEPKPLYTPPTQGKRVYRDAHAGMTEEQKLKELNNLDRGEVTEDFEDSSFADRK